MNTGRDGDYPNHISNIPTVYCLNLVVSTINSRLLPIRFVRVSSLETRNVIQHLSNLGRTLRDDNYYFVSVLKSYLFVDFFFLGREEKTTKI